MAADYYKMGYSAFLAGGMTEQQIKQQHPLFRAGYRAAERQAEQKNKSVSDIRVQKVERPTGAKYELQWKDIATVLTFHPWNVLSRRRALEPIHTAIMRSVEKRHAEIHKFGDIIDMVRQYWELMLEEGLKEGVLDMKDMKHYNYVPRSQR